MAHEFPVRVYYEDTDLAGFVYHANYLRFIERGRTEALTEAGIDQRALKAEAGIVFAVRRMDCDWFAPAFLLDRLRVVTALGALGGASAELDQRIWRGADCLFRARVTVVAIGANGRATRIPEAARAALAALGPTEGTDDTGV
ncbi:tol-pal system-associated acyl-CoA thioesterase [Amaricoccus solimangrovi]|uniref:Tol-pal system-associated acyl-CoA thioesterase n=1 Tax=Amaricoccus solimangrovi TaxID=2589815 RepID=A0A501X1D3_9RHOB|nr:tol-pal system-associated acyl-CoA thioesterase [Amaricoccus solimangrovi]TPE53786.1 tol-pal system-associated acyl-CoA thioesterase [Amaricoccus solimangrovi]